MKTTDCRIPTAPRNLTSWWNCQELMASAMLLASCHWAVAQPLIRTQPANTTVSLGATARFTVSATSTHPPITYQWWFKEAALDAVANPSAAKSLLSLTNVTLADGGPYFVVVSDTSGLVATSRVAALTVDPTFVKITQRDIVTDMWVPYWLDLDGDGWLELVVVGGFLTEGGSKPLMVYENSRDGTLSRTLTHDLSKMSARFGTVAWADLDNDGDLDGLAGVVETQTAIYLRNEGGGRFTKVVADRSWTANQIAVVGTAPASADMDNDGFLDLVVGYFGNFATGVWGTNAVLHGLGNGRVEVDRTSALAVSHTFTEHWGWADYDGDGNLDLFGTTTGNPDQVDLMFHNLGGGQFLRVTNSPLAEIRDISVAPVWGDYDNDGDLDLFVSHKNQTNQLYRNLGNGVFDPSPTGPSFPEAQDRGVAAWADYDNDGWLDLFVPGRFRSQLFHNHGDGTFEEITTGSLESECRGYGSAWGDYDNDGFLDLVVANDAFSTGVNHLFRNNLRQVGNTNGWLKVKLVGTASNRDGIGATIHVKATIGGKVLWQMRQKVCQSYEAALLAHFGLGDTTQVETLRITWPSGLVQELADLTPNQSLTITEHQEGVTNAPSVTASRSANGTVQLTLMGQPNLLYVFEASTNLVQWAKLAVRTNLTGAVDFTDSAAINYPQRFYRGVAP